VLQAGEMLPPVSVNPAATSLAGRNWKILHDRGTFPGQWGGASLPARRHFGREGFRKESQQSGRLSKLTADG
jgi:hypothetical protein